MKRLTPKQIAKQIMKNQMQICEGYGIEGYEQLNDELSESVRDQVQEELSKLVDRAYRTLGLIKI